MGAAVQQRVGAVVNPGAYAGCIRHPRWLCQLRRVGAAVNPGAYAGSDGKARRVGAAVNRGAHAGL